MPDLYVASSYTGNILKFDGTSGAFSSVFATGNNLVEPYGIAFDANGKLYVSNNNRAGFNVLRFRANGDFDTVFASGQNLSNPLGLAFDANGKLYVSNPGVPNSLRWNADGTFDQVFTAHASIVLPRGLAFDANGKLYVANRQPFGITNILRFAADGAFDQVFATGNLSQPGAITFGTGGDTNLYVADGARQAVLSYDSSGTFKGFFATAGPMGNPVGLAISGDFMYVGHSISTLVLDGAPASNSAISRYSKSTGAFDKIFSSGVALNSPTFLAWK